MEGLPLYELNIKDEGEEMVSAISLVDYPAIQIDWQAFSKKERFQVKNEDKKIVAGFAMVADIPIYRRDASGEYNVVFRPDTILQIAQRFFREKRNDKANLMHTDIFPKGVYVFTSFIINKERGILTPKGFEEQPDGSWFIEMKIDNDEVWNEVKEGNFKGFSIEGIFEHNRINMKQETKLEKAMSFFKELFSDESPQVEVEAEADEVTLGEATLADGTLVVWEGELMEGTAIFVVNDEGEQVAAPDGEHELSDGSAVIKTENGMVVEIVAVESEEGEDEMEKVLAEMKEIKTELAETQTEFDELGNAYAELEHKFKALETEKAEAFAKVEKLEGEKAEATKEIEKLKNEEFTAPITKTKSRFNFKYLK